MTEYEYIEWYDLSNGLKQKRVGIKIGEYLTVCYTSRHDKTYRIFNTITGKPVIRTKFVHLEDAVELAQKISDTVGEYFYMNIDYPQLDMVEVSRWSTDGGVELCDMVNKVKSQDRLERMLT